MVHLLIGTRLVMYMVPMLARWRVRTLTKTHLSLAFFVFLLLPCAVLLSSSSLSCVFVYFSCCRQMCLEVTVATASLLAGRHSMFI